MSKSTSTAVHLPRWKMALGSVVFVVAAGSVLEFNFSASRRLEAMSQTRVDVEHDASNRRQLARTRELVIGALPAAESSLRFFREHLALLQPSDSLGADAVSTGSALVDVARLRLSVANGSAFGLALTNDEREHSSRNLSRALERIGTSIGVLDRFFREYRERGSVAAITNLRGMAPWLSAESMAAVMLQLHAWVDATADGRPEVARNGAGDQRLFMARLWISPVAVLYCAWFILFMMPWRRNLPCSGDPSGSTARTTV